MHATMSRRGRRSSAQAPGARFSLLLLLPLLSLLGGPAAADGISGRVYAPDGKALPNAILTARPEKGPVVDFKTDASGNFSVFLDPGRWVVSVRADASLEGVLESSSQPVQQDVHLKKVTR